MKNPTFPLILKQAMKRSKNRDLETKINDVQAQTLEEQPVKVGSCNAS